MNRRVLFFFLSMTALCVGCNLSDPVVGGPTNNADPGPDGGGDISDATNTPDGDDTTPDAGVPNDAEAPDGGPDAGDSELPDMGTPLTAENYPIRFSEAICDALLRLDYQPSDFYYWTTPAECLRAYTMLQGAELELLVYDARQGRLGLDLDTANDTLDYLAATDHPADFGELPSLLDAFLPLASPGDACSTDTACEDDADGNTLPCFKADSSACEGGCTRPPVSCGGSYCTFTQYCDRATSSCVEQQPDGTSCVSDAQCLNHCVGDGIGGAACGALLLDQDCSMNRGRCADGLHCAPGSLTCRPIAADGEACGGDQGCGDLSFCDNGTCAPLGDGTRCRFNRTCTEGLSCVRIAADGTSDRGCYSVRATGDPCQGDHLCADTDFCDYDQPIAVCAPRHQISESCSRERQCAPGLACRRADDGSSSCEPWQWGLGEGEVCFSDAATCSFGLYCVRDSPGSRRGRCQARQRPLVGEPCDVWGECVDGFCGPDAQCVAYLAAGEACNSDLECESNACTGEPSTCAASHCPLP